MTKLGNHVIVEMHNKCMSIAQQLWGLCHAVGASGVIATVVFGLYGNATAAWGMTAKARPCAHLLCAA